MPANYSSVYLRHSLPLEAPARWRRWRLVVRHDGGFVAFVNGREVYRARAGNAGELLPPSAKASRAVRGELEETRVPILAELLRPGGNLLAVQALSRGVGVERFFLAVKLEAESAPDAGRDQALAARAEGLAGSEHFRAARSYLTARLLERRGRFQEAAAILRLLRDEDSKDVRVLCRLVESLRASGEAESAKEFFRAAFAGDNVPTVPAADLEPLRRGAWRILRLGDQPLEDYYRAARWSEQVRRSSPPLPVNITDLGVMGIARFRLGLHREALELLLKARPAHAFLHRGKSDPSTVAFLAMVFHRLERAEEARRTFTELLDPAKTEPWGAGAYVLEAATVLGMPLAPSRVGQ